MREGERRWRARRGEEWSGVEWSGVEWSGDVPLHLVRTSSAPCVLRAPLA